MFLRPICLLSRRYVSFPFFFPISFLFAQRATLLSEMFWAEARAGKLNSHEMSWHCKTCGRRPRRIFWTDRTSDQLSGGTWRNLDILVRGLAPVRLREAQRGMRRWQIAVGARGSLPR